MIVVRIELWPGGNPTHAEDLGTAHIANESSLADISTYSVRLLKGARYSRHPGDVWRTGEVQGYPRTSTLVGPWELLYMGLKSALGNRVERVERLCAEGMTRAVKLAAKVAEGRYAIGLWQADNHSPGGFTHGPTPDLDSLLAESLDADDIPEGFIAFLVRQGARGESIPLYIWDGEEWIPL